ncbi:hypothetical protein GCM10009613_65610 [Pseudonocardia kongjuensis]|uniref:Sigma-70 family RNA polymerase sigma factor n=1 Tax=Pseudonocardia kongjuensis TaxID=102227 RepID=A0ABP4J2Y3_9PSEU
MNAQSQNTERLTAAQAETRIRRDEAARIATTARRGLPMPSADQLTVRAALALLPAGHAVASVARTMCREFGHDAPHGGIACGRCWEHAIRNDERVVIEFGLTARDEEPDPSYVDEVAVHRALNGEVLPLGENEQDEVIRRMNSEGLSPSAISEVTGLRYRTVRARLSALVPPVVGDVASGAHHAPQVA